MRERLISYIDYLFKDAPEDARDIQSEIKSNTLDKYDDFIASGKSEEEAFNAAAAGIGDVGALLNEMKMKKADPREQKSTVMRSLLLALSVALYILSPIPVIILESVNENLGICLMFTLVAVATALIIYRSTAYKRYEMKSDSETEHMKAKKAGEAPSSPLQSAILSLLWTITVIVYLIISFLFSSWGISWVIFIIASAIHHIINASFYLWTYSDKSKKQD
ncbi:MAG: hypothetical protein HFE77_06930 [Clostridiales bacterium]|nr:hypothetical protein [Clostridiales bacterium]